MITDFTLFFTWELRLWQQARTWTWQTINAPLLKPTLSISLQKVPFCCSIGSKVAAFAKEPPLFFNAGDSQKTTSADLITASAPSAQDDGDVT